MGYIKQITIPGGATYDIAPTQMNPTAAAGDALTPVYINSNGIPTAVNMSTSGDRWNVIPIISSSGVLEVGKYIDFHDSDDDTGDYSNRLTSNTTYIQIGDNSSAGKTLRNISYGTADPSGGKSGDVYIQYT